MNTEDAPFFRRPTPIVWPVWMIDTGHSQGEPSAAALRASVERGDPLAVLRSVPVLPQLETGECERGPSFPTLPARADEPVADDPCHPAGEAGVVVADTDREYRAAMEHARKDRLARWQTVGSRR